MADTKITDLTSLTAATDDEIPINRAGIDGKVTAGDIAALAGGGGGGGVSNFLALTDTVNSYTALDDAYVKVNNAKTGLDFRYSTADHVDIRDYLSSGPRDVVSGEDITSAVAAVVANRSSGDAHLKKRIYFPPLTDGGSCKLLFDAASITWGSVAWNFMIDTQILSLTSQWSLPGVSRLIGLNTIGGVPQFMKGPLRNRIEADTSWSSGAVPLIDLDASTGRNVIISDLKITAQNGATNCIKLDWDSHGLYRLHLSSDAAEALWIEHAFWVNMEDICVETTVTQAPTVYAAKFATEAATTNVGLIRIRDFLCVGGGVLFKSGSGHGDVTNTIIDEMHSEGLGNGQSLLNFDSQGGAVTSITIRQPGLSDSIGGGVYLIHNDGAQTTNITIDGGWRFAQGVFDPASGDVIRGLSLAERSMQQDIIAYTDVNESVVDYWAGSAVSDRFPSVETGMATDKLLISQSVGVPWVLGTVKNIAQDPASWTTSGGAITATGIPGPHGGTTNVGRCTGGTNTLGSFSMTPALGDFFLAGVWVRGSGCPTADIFPVLQTTTAGFGFNNSSDPTIGRGDYIYNVDDDGWHWVSFLYKLTTVTGGAGTFTFKIGQGETFDVFNPCVMHIPAATANDEVGLMRYQRSWRGGVGGGAATAAPSAGDVSFPDNQNVFVNAKCSANTLALVDGVTAPSTVSGQAIIYVDTADGDLKVKFGDGTIKTIVVDT